MSVPQNRKWTVLKRQDIVDFRARHRLTKVGCARALGISAVSLHKYMEKGPPPLEKKQHQLLAAIQRFDEIEGKKSAPRPNPVPKARPTPAPKAPPAPKPQPELEPAPVVWESPDALILQIVLKHMESGAAVDDVPAYIQQIKSALR